jgi:UTP-glucose-1-phosphate uridylyltransferase
MKPTLVVIAAGMGNRYGGLKQIDSIGPNGEILIDYSIYDAVRAGFEKLVFVIRRDLEDTFKQKISGKFESNLEVSYAYQEIDAYLDGFELSQHRKKPWGTGHAILTAGKAVAEPFVAINADDYYGHNSFKIIADYMSSGEMLGGHNHAMVGYILRNTLSEYGYVCRAVCHCGPQMLLDNIVERTKIKNKQTQRFTSTNQERLFI